MEVDISESELKKYYMNNSESESIEHYNKG